MHLTPCSSGTGRMTGWMTLSSTCSIGSTPTWTSRELRIMFFDFSSAFNTIQLLLPREKLERIGVDPFFTSWITDYLTGRLQFVRLGSCASDIVVSSTGAPQGPVLAPFLFTLYTSDFTYNSGSCHVQKYSDNTAIVACEGGAGGGVQGPDESLLQLEREERPSP